ncbi:MAG: hypothetical protein JWR60_1628 [Polaromonas sp.]|nr:hypothetical protein [Polaromonas sp.]
MWRFLEPAYAKRFRTVKFDLVGAGQSDLSAYDRNKYSTLQGYADDVLEIIKEFGEGLVIFVGHSVSTMIGMLADLKEPGRIAAHAMIGPSPCYINDGDYVAGFERKDIEALLLSMENNYLAWAGTLAPLIMGAPGKPELGVELANSFRRADPEIAKQFARVAFLSDHRSQLPRLKTPALILQCSDDFLAPVTVGTYMSRVMPQGTLKMVKNIGHCPHLSEPGPSIQAIDEFLVETGLERPDESGSLLARMLELLDHFPCGLAQADQYGLLLRANSTFCNWLGYTRDELIGKLKIEELLTKGSRIFYQTHVISHLQQNGSISEVRAEVLRKDGQTLPIVLNAIQHENQGITTHDLAIFVAQDRERYEKELIDSRTRLEVMVEHATQLQAQAKERAEFAEQMVGIVSHDLRNPLMTVLMSAELLGKGSITGDQSDTLKRILKAGGRASRLMDDLLDLTQARSGSGLSVTPAAIDLHEVVSDAVDELAHAFPGRQLLHVRQGQSTNLCLVDAHRLAQLVGNLVSNAIAYGDPAAPIIVTSSSGEDACSVAVQNQGTPIPQEKMANLFQPMVRGSHDDSKSHSVGLGLFIVNEIAKAHGGSMTVVSTPEQGTVFTAHFPYRQPQAAPAPDGADSSS